MGKTYRRSKDDIGYREGQSGCLRTYRCKCLACTNQKRKNKNTTSVDEALDLDY